MQFLKFSILFILSISSLSFSGTECFEQDLATEVSHKSFPFGLLEKRISIKKKNCEFTIKHEQLKYLKKSWVVDICRAPVHIKDTSGSVEVLRRVEECTSVKDEFCKSYKTIKRYLEDDGMIFADGSKSNISSEYGKVYCSYLLINEYLNKGLVFNRESNYDYLVKTKTDDSKSGQILIDPNSGKANF